MNNASDDNRPSEILVVDDIAANRNLLLETLEPKGYEVLLAADGQSALEIARNVVPDAVLLDVNMPGIDGFETCRALKQSEVTRQIPVIFITANEGTDDVVAAFQAGGVDYVTKPFKPEEVLTRLATHLEISRLTRALVANNAQLQAARKAAEAASEAKSQFLASMSHELRTPLNAIIGYSEMLQEDLEALGVKQCLADLQKIHAAARHQLGLINDILDLSKVEAGKMTLFVEEFDVAQLVKEVTATVQPLVARKANTLLLECPPGLGTMRADQTKVRQTLFNLLSNAAKFTDKGLIRLSVRRSLLDDAQAQTVQFSVSDNGIGMTSEQLGKLFQAFSQADPSTGKKFGGTGLGLVLCRKFCRLMGGEVSVRSEYGHGTTFTVTLPTEVAEAGPTDA
jgi:signal transduction histidine kinase